MLTGILIEWIADGETKEMGIMTATLLTLILHLGSFAEVSQAIKS